MTADEKSLGALTVLSHYRYRYLVKGVEIYNFVHISLPYLQLYKITGKTEVYSKAHDAETFLDSVSSNDEPSHIFIRLVPYSFAPSADSLA